MPDPLVSVIIPAHNGADLIHEAIRSVLDQSHSRLELIVVDDGSSDATADVVNGFTDPRLTYLSHPRSQGACAARATGLRASHGEIIAFLDQDDLFHREKLAAHVAFLAAHPDTGFTYNPHFTLSHPSGWVIDILRPPATLTLDDLVLGYPIPPSAWVLRREWAVREDLWDPATFYRGREIVFCGRLFVAGCRFSLVDRVLHYRRIEVGRRFGDPASKCRDERLCQEIMLDDGRCPPEVRARRPAAYASSDLVWANVALVQRETETGRTLLRRAIELSPDLVCNDGSRLVEFFLAHAVIDADDAEAQLRTIADQLPPGFEAVAGQVRGAIGDAHLEKAAQHVLWGRPAEAQPHLARASALGAVAGPRCLQRLGYYFLSYDAEFGPGAASGAVRQLAAAFRANGDRQGARRLGGTYHLSRAFQHYAGGEHRHVPRRVLRAFAEDPGVLRNRGAWSILLRSAVARGSTSPTLATTQ